MVDTLTISFELSNLEYNEIFTKINEKVCEMGLNNKKLHKDKNNKSCYVTNLFAQYGFQEIRLRTYNEKYYRAIEIQLRPKLLIDKNNYIDVTKIEEFIEVNKRFNYYINKLELNLPEFFNWNVIRIDYAIDLDIDQNYIGLYIQQFKKGNIPKEMLLNSITKNYFESETNVYLKCKSLCINFYNRYETLIDKAKKNNKTYNNIENARNKFRFEVQCFTIKTNNIKANFKFPNKKVVYFLNKDICTQVILRCFNKVIDKGNYYKLEDAIKIIENSKYELRKQFRLIRLLKFIDNSGSIWMAKKCLEKNKDYNNKGLKKFYKDIDSIRILGVNPVVIPKERKENNLEDLGDRIRDYFGTN